MPDQSGINTKAEEIISVCIATFKRESLLENLLISLNKQELPENIKLEVVVTDNNAAASAKSILKKFTSANNVCYKYFVEPEKNISLARNKCLENSTGKFICFIDDDEMASDTWINNLYTALIKYKADAVFGYVEPVFDENIPPHFHKRDFYFSPVGKTGTEALFYFTTNAMVKTDLIKSEGIPFDPLYGLTGGEDAHLFERLKRKGAKFIVSREAITYENIPLERGTTIYLYNRALRGGQAFIRRQLIYDDRLFVKLFKLTKAFIILVISLFLLLLTFFFKSTRNKFIISLGASVGKIRGLMNKYKELH